MEHYNSMPIWATGLFRVGYVSLYRTRGAGTARHNQLEQSGHSDPHAFYCSILISNVNKLWQQKKQGIKHVTPELSVYPIITWPRVTYTI